MEVRPAQAEQLGVGVGKQPALQQRIVGEVDARHDVAGMERRLLGLGEEVVRVAVEHHLADHFERHDFLRDQLGGIEHVEVEAVGRLLVERLDGELEFGEVALCDRFEEIAAMEIRDRRR